MKELIKRKSEKECISCRNSSKGITLLALVITIIVIIILATVAISFAFGENGLINRAEQAKDLYSNDTKYTEESITNVESYLNEMIEGVDGSEPNPPQIPTGTITFTNMQWVGDGTAKTTINTSEEGYQVQ